MRVFALFAALCGLLVTSVAAHDQILRGRGLHAMDNSESLSVEGYTKVFCMSDRCHAPPPEFEGGALIGMILGFGVTGCFVIFGFITIILDEKRRHIAYAE